MLASFPDLSDLKAHGILVLAKNLLTYLNIECYMEVS